MYSMIMKKEGNVRVTRFTRRCENRMICDEKTARKRGDPEWEVSQTSSPFSNIDIQMRRINILLRAFLM